VHKDRHLKTRNERHVVNKLIDGLPSKERASVLGRCDVVELTFGDVIFEAGPAIHHAYFPLDGFISLLTLLDDHQPLEMALIGNEGMVGITLTLGVSTAPMRAIVQGAGQALQMKAEDLKQLLIECPIFKQALNRYLYVTMRQFPHIAACTHFHEIEPRLARWLLMTHDRSSSDSFHLTHEFLAGMLGVRRSGITIAARALQLRKLIDYRRGEITILNRKGLEKASCTCYQTLINDYEKQFSSVRQIVRH
jgi:CRP-like cAMP-binding protein